MASSNRSIRDFFKPAAQANKPSWESLTTQHTVPNGRRIWPSPRTQTRNGETATPNRSSPTPTPTPKEPSPPTIHKTPQSDGKNHGADTSFSSLASSSSTKSRRVVIDGEDTVLNSDSEGDSSDSLEEMDRQLRKRDFKGRAIGEAALRNQRARDTIRVPLKPKKSTLSMSAVVAAAKRNDEEAQRTLDIQIDINKPKEEKTQAENAPINQGLLASYVGNGEDGDKAERFAQAMKRTGALNLDTAWQFFSEQKENFSTNRFPTESLPAHGWAANLQDPLSRDAAFLSGFTRNVFRYQALPPELASWIIDELVIGSQEDLNFEYLRTLEASSKALREVLTPPKLNNLFLRLGGLADAFDHTCPIVPITRPPNTPKLPIPPSLRWVVLLIERAASSISSECRLHALNVLVRLSIDDSILGDPGLQANIQSAIESVISSIPDTELNSSLHALTSTLLSTLTSPILQNSLILSFPANTPLTHLYQRHLALSFFLAPERLTVPLTDPSLPDILIAHLDTSPKFTITKETDYNIFASRFSLLDVAIGPGLTSVPYHPPSTDLSLLQTPEEKAFNAVVDVLASKVQSLNNEIVAAGGMSDLSRCEAKEVADRLYYRLESAVRTRGRKRRGVFGDEKEEEEERRGFRSFFKRKGEGAVNGVNGTA